MKGLVGSLLAAAAVVSAVPLDERQTNEYDYIVRLSWPRSKRLYSHVDRSSDLALVADLLRRDLHELDNLCS